jgi:hypothetical protein
MPCEHSYAHVAKQAVWAFFIVIVRKGGIMPTIKDERHKLSCTVSAETYDYLEQRRRAAPLGALLDALVEGSKFRERALEVLEHVEALLHFIVNHHCPHCHNEHIGGTQ